MKRIRQILECYEERPQLWFSLGCDPGHYFASTTDHSQNQDDRLLIYMWSPGTQLEFGDRSHSEFLRGVRAANGMAEIPPVLLKKKGVKIMTVRMEEGGT